MDVDAGRWRQGRSANAKRITAIRLTWQATKRHKLAATPNDEAVSDMLRTYWTNFAKTGDPNGAGLSRWPAFTNASPRMLHIESDNTAAVPVVGENGLKVLDEYFAWRRTTAVPPPAARRSALP